MTLARRIIPCLDVRDGVVVKGVQFRNHEVLGNMLSFAQRYRDEGADELVFYDITASSEGRLLSKEWVRKIGEILDIPFCVAGGIRSVEQAREVLNFGADKVSVNSPALERPDLINELVRAFGTQCVVVGVDSQWVEDDYYVYQYTGSEVTTRSTRRKTKDWLIEVQARGAGEIVLNCMSSDGTKEGYDVKQLRKARAILNVPLIASGGAGTMKHFSEVFKGASVDGALAAGVFHRKEIEIASLKKYLEDQSIEVRR